MMRGAEKFGCSPTPLQELARRIPPVLMPTFFFFFIAFEPRVESAVD
jgi:hypothetical protein